MATIRKRFVEVVDYMGQCPKCRKTQYAQSAALADCWCKTCSMAAMKKPEGPQS